MATHLRDPMRRSAYALILATGLTSGLGLVFWALAARWLPTATVGLGAALVSVMALLANLSTLGLRNGLIRFLPTAGSASRRLIVTCYALCAVTAMVAAGIFLLGQPLWAEKLAFLRDSPLSVLAFVIGTAFWVLFVLQDHVLVGLRQTIWVPLENGLCAVAKIALLPLLAFAGGWAVFGAAALPAAAAVLVVTTLVMRYLRRTTAGQERTAIPVSQLVRFAAADHFAALLWMGTADLLTLLVLNEVGPEASAYYFMANTIGYTLYLVISNIGSALVAEGARDPERAVTLARQALWNSARLVIPLAVVGVLAGPVRAGHPRSRLRRQRDGGAAAAADLRHPAGDRRHRHRHRPHPAGPAHDHGRLHRAGDRLDRGQLAGPGPARHPRRGPGLPPHPAGGLRRPADHGSDGSVRRTRLPQRDRRAGAAAATPAPPPQPAGDPSAAGPGAGRLRAGSADAVPDADVGLRHPGRRPGGGTGAA